MTIKDNPIDPSLLNDNKCVEAEFTIDHARKEIIGALNRYGDEFPELKEEIFYYNKILKCFIAEKKI